MSDLITVLVLSGLLVAMWEGVRRLDGYVVIPVSIGALVATIVVLAVVRSFWMIIPHWQVCASVAIGLSLGVLIMRGIKSGKSSA